MDELATSLKTVHFFRQHPCFSDIVRRVKLEVETKDKSGCETVDDFDPFENRLINNYFHDWQY